MKLNPRQSHVAVAYWGINASCNKRAYLCANKPRWDTRFNRAIPQSRRPSKPINRITHIGSFLQI